MVTLIGSRAHLVMYPTKSFANGAPDCLNYRRQTTRQITWKKNSARVIPPWFYVTEHRLSFLLVGYSLHTRWSNETSGLVCLELKQNKICNLLSCHEPCRFLRQHTKWSTIRLQHLLTNASLTLTARLYSSSLMLLFSGTKPYDVLNASRAFVLNNWDVFNLELRNMCQLTSLYRLKAFSAALFVCLESECWMSRDLVCI